MLKASKYNVIVGKEDSLRVLNTLSGNIAVVRERRAKGYLTGGKIDEKDDIAGRLVKDGFLVYEETDEDAIAEVKYLDIIANKELYLVLIPTTACNFRCIYCYENNPESENNFKEVVMNEEVQQSIVLYAEKKLKQHFGMFVEWYGGEPLLCLDVVEKISDQLVNLCQKRGKPYYSTLTSNGFLLTEEVFRRCLKSHIFSFHITLDGFDFIHDKLRFLSNGNGTQNTVLTNLRNIRDKVESQYFKIIIRTNVTTDLVPYLEEWMGFLEDEFGRDKRFGFFFRPVENRGGTSINTKQDIIIEDKMLNAYDIMIKSTHRLDFSYIKPFMYNAICGAAKRNHYIIDPNGIVKKCGEYLNHPLSNVGYLNKNGEMILDKDSFSRWVKIGSKTGNEMCASCKGRVSCFNRNCPMRQGVGFQKGYYCGVESKYMEKILELLTEGNYEFIMHY